VESKIVYVSAVAWPAGSAGERRMSLTEWNARYELGVREMDDHHRKLVELLNKAYELILYSFDEDKLHVILSELVKYADYHFSAEEALMKEAGFAGRKMHVSSHNTFKEHLAGLRKSSHSEDPHVINDMVLFLWDWLNRHILDYDKKFAVYLSRK
jgi:hemerythrin